MKTLSKYAQHIPYFYFLFVVGYWFTDVNKTNGASAFPILLFGLPFLWQIIKPNKKLNFTLGITFVCLSSYLIMAYLLDFFHITSITTRVNDFIIFGGLFVVSNFAMALWIVKNSLRQSV